MELVIAAIVFFVCLLGGSAALQRSVGLSVESRDSYEYFEDEVDEEEK